MYIMCYINAILTKHWPSNNHVLVKDTQIVEPVPSERPVKLLDVQYFLVPP